MATTVVTIITSLMTLIGALTGALAGHIFTRRNEKIKRAEEQYDRWESEALRITTELMQVASELEDLIVSSQGSEFEITTLAEELDELPDMDLSQPLTAGDVFVDAGRTKQLGQAKEAQKQLTAKLEEFANFKETANKKMATLSRLRWSLFMYLEKEANEALTEMLAVLIDHATNPTRRSSMAEELVSAQFGFSEALRRQFLRN